MAYLLDTSILVRLANANDKQRGLVFDSLAVLHRRGEGVWIAPQSLIEFWNVATRPLAVNGLGLPIAEAAELISFFEAEFELAKENPELFPIVKSIAAAVGVIGKQIHDARLVAVCHVHHIPALLTFNVRHFVRLATVPPGVNVIDPPAVIHSM